MEGIARKVLGATVRRTKVGEKLEHGVGKVLDQVKQERNSG